MVSKRMVFSCLLCIGTLFGMGAAKAPVVEMNLLSSYSYGLSSHTYNDAVLPSLTISIASEASGNVRGEVVLRASSPTIDDLVYKAFCKIRFPSFRLTLGKTRLSWGDGTLFNAADVLYGSSSTAVDLIKEQLRTETGWMTSLSYPLGAFSFLETVLLPSPDHNLGHLGFGLRYYTTALNMKIELGYATRMENGRQHKPYFSLQGNIGPDWYLGSSLTIAQENPTTSEIAESYLVSGGLFHLLYLSNDRTMSLRFELLARPFGTWEFASQTDGDAALLFYPELVYTPSSSLSYSIRSIISPLDLSTLLMIGTTWSAFEGFNFVLSLSSPFGDSGDLFNWDGIQKISLQLGASWIF